ncbi:amino acid adenylation domain-containing protein [Streptomyces sp. NPDC090798]|uniref:amino acid adenylation domain-containing protein n=1 Tax=Streptomyces sp. NPDC090798 TaxID=3365968 RepID=UPI0038131CE3
MAQVPNPQATVHQRFAEQARRTPDAIALTCGRQRLTYAEVERRASSLAQRLLALRVRPEEPVALLMERSAELVVSILGVLKAGACYLPLHGADPTARHRTVLDEAGARILLADRAVPELDARGLAVLDAAEATAVPEDAARAVEPQVPCTDGRLAYVIFTSGSTGSPKGVAVTHRDVLDLVDDGLWTGGRHERVLMLAPHAFDVSTYELWVPLLRGGHLVLAPPEVDVDTLRSLITTHRITGLHLTAGLFRVVAEAAPECFATVREVMTGGDVVSPAAVARVLDTCPDTVVRAMYGPTETTLFATHHPMSEPPHGDVPLGRPLDGVSVHVLDEKLAPVENGEAGEIYLAGPGVARGYLGQAALTSQRFAADPFGAPGSRMYRTGDLGRRNAHGELEFLGRVGNQVKVRGFRVELGEIETVLARVSGAAQVVVISHGEDANDRNLVAYLVAGPRGGVPDDAELVRRLGEMLPDYMVPSSFVRLPALPLTPNGKVDYRALPEPEKTGGAGGPAPRDAREEQLAGLFAAALGVQRVGIHDDFFDLGGSSLAATRLISRIRSELGVRLSMRDLLDRRTVAGLSAAVGTDEKSDAGTEGLRPLLKLRAQGSGAPLFCIHPGGGMAWCYVGLLRHLPKDIPVYGLQARGLTGREPVAADMAELVEDYLAQIRRIQPEGPYRLLGWSFGGNVAHMMAARLRRAGERVSLLAVLDSSHGGARSAPRSPSQRDTLKLAFDGLPAFDAEPGTGPIPAERVRQILREADSPLAGIGARTVEAITATTTNNIRISDAGRPEHFDGDLLFFEATDAAGRSSGLADVWRPYTGGTITRIQVEAEHLRLMTPAALERIGPIAARHLAPTV